MKIEKVLWQHRRDFRAVFVCESCGNTCEMSGYDDANFHESVIPDMKCKKCGESSNSLGVDYRPLATRYPEGYQI